jgi:phosphatidylserine/phosphatidylglycerophosphate/cardiolipin synthase-like enzyme
VAGSVRLARRSLIKAADAAAGDAVEALVRAHHRRRLRRVGWGDAFAASGDLWAAGDPPPRAGNAVEILVDGASALPRIAEELEHAQSSVHIAGWYVSTELALVRDGERVVLLDLLAELAKRIEVRVLIWAGAPLPLFEPSRVKVRHVRERLEAAGVRCGLDSRERPMHCHHEKLVLIDERIAYAGGIDLTTFAGDRYDSSEHPYRSALGWHDAAARVEGPAVADLAAHFRLRWREVTGEALAATPVPARAGDRELQLVRTVPEGIYDAVPHGDFRIFEAYVRALRSAQRLIYVESQFLWSPELVKILADKLRNPPCDDFRLVLVLPAHPQSGGDTTRGQLGVLADADADAGRFVACCLYARNGAESCPIYVHAKIGIVDDRWLTIGSANLNEHSLFNDTEVNLVSCDEELARTTRERLWAEHLELDAQTAAGDPLALVEEWWKPISTEQLERRNNGRPPTHRLVRLEGTSRRSRRLFGPLQSLVVDG